MIDKSPQKIKEMFNNLSGCYDSYNNFISLFLHKFIKKKAVKSLDIKQNLKILDLCCGTGDLAGIIQKNHPENEITGIDFSSKMLEIAKRKNKNIKFIEAQAEKIPFKDNCFDIILMSFGLRNIKDIDSSIEEIYRVLEYKGKFLHLDFGNKTLTSRIYDTILTLIIKLFFKNKNSYFYLINSKKEFLSPDELVKKFESFGFKHLKTKYYLCGIISYQIFKKP